MSTTANRTQRIEQHRAAAVIALAVLWAVCVPGVLSSEGQQSTVEEAKAAFVHMFALYTIWPTNPPVNTAFVVGVLGDDAVLSALEKLARTNVVNKRKMEIRRISGEQDAGGCDLLYVGASAMKAWPRILSQFKEASVLTVGDADQFHQDGMITLVSKPGRKGYISFAYVVNREAARRANLKFGADLIAMAQP